MRNEIGLIRLCEGTETRDQRVRNVVSERREVEIEIVEGGEEIGGVEAGRDAVSEVVIFAVVGVGEVADVAVKRGVADEGLCAVEFGAVI